jgi:hypothetical protein
MGLSTTGHHHELGTNVGVLAAHAVGERGIQLTLKAFHTGGVQEQGGGGLLNSFARFQQLTMLPQKIPNSAALAMKLRQDREDRERPHRREDLDRRRGAPRPARRIAPAPLHKELAHAAKLPGYQPWEPPTIGMHVEAGQHLSDPNQDPHQPAPPLRGHEERSRQVQNHLTNEIHGLYKGEGHPSRARRTVVKAMSNLTKIVDPGDHLEVLRGEFRPTSVVKKMNEELVKQKLRSPSSTRRCSRGSRCSPSICKRTGWRSCSTSGSRTRSSRRRPRAVLRAIHGLHPIPGIAFGAEFGLTSAVSKRPEYQHLGNVPTHHY